MYRYDDDYDGPDTSGPNHECKPILNGICGCSCHDLEDCGCECCRWDSDGDSDDDRFKTYEVKLLIEVGEHTYWPTGVKQRVSDDPNDPFKDDQSHLVTLLRDAVNGVLGLEFSGATTTEVPNGGGL